MRVIQTKENAWLQVTDLHATLKFSSRKEILTTDNDLKVKFLCQILQEEDEFLKKEKKNL